MSSLLRLSCLLAVLATQSIAAEPKAVLTGPERVAPGDLVILDASASTAESFSWESTSDKAFLPVDGGMRCVFSSGQPGTYRFTVTVATVEGGKPLQASARHVVIIGTGPAPPGPTPGPGPVPPGPIPDPEPPTPAPVVGRLAVSYVVDAVNQTPAQAAIRTDPTVRAALRAADANWYTYQSGEEELAARRLTSRIGSVGYPACVIQDQASGAVLDVRKVNSAAEVIDAVKRIRGGK